MLKSNSPTFKSNFFFRSFFVYFVIFFNTNAELDNNEENGNVFVPKAEWGGTFKVPPNLANPNGLSKKQEIMVRSAIKYWVERHKHVVR